MNTLWTVRVPEFVLQGSIFVLLSEHWQHPWTSLDSFQTSWSSSLTGPNKVNSRKLNFKGSSTLGTQKHFLQEMHFPVILTFSSWFCLYTYNTQLCSAQLSFKVLKKYKIARKNQGQLKAREKEWVFRLHLKDSTVGKSPKFWSNGGKGPVPIVLRPGSLGG